VKPLYICVHLITYSHTDSATAAFPVRSLSQGPDYRPDWRWRTCERYLVQVSTSKDKEAEVDHILARERDPYLRQLIRYQFNRRCIIGSRIEYALRCRATNAETRAGSMVKAMTLAGRTSQQIAPEIGTDEGNITAFQRIFFDVSRYMTSRVWLARLCCPPDAQNHTAEAEWEMRWMWVALHRGWAGLSSILFGKRYSPLECRPTELDHLVRMLLGRASDYVAIMDIAGVPVSQRDLELLLLLPRRIGDLGLPITLENLVYAEPLEPEEEKRQKKAKDIVKGLSLEQRKKIVRVFEWLQHKADVIDVDSKTGEQENRSF
jgi:hypothetical protein